MVFRDLSLNAHAMCHIMPVLNAYICCVLIVNQLFVSFSLKEINKVICAI
jgi:hypothetical protein